MFLRILADPASIGNTTPEFPDIVNISRQGLSVLFTAMKTFGAFSPLSSTLHAIYYVFRSKLTMPLLCSAALATKVELHPSSRF
jgi:hypothetical protein